MKQNIYAIRRTIVKNIKKETIERIFADTKEKHGMRYTKYRDLEKLGAYDACFRRGEPEKISHLAVGAYVFISFIIQK